MAAQASSPGFASAFSAMPGAVAPGAAKDVAVSVARIVEYRIVFINGCEQWRFAERKQPVRLRLSQSCGGESESADRHRVFAELREHHGRCAKRRHYPLRQCVREALAQRLADEVQTAADDDYGGVYEVDDVAEGEG